LIMFCTTTVLTFIVLPTISISLHTQTLNNLRKSFYFLLNLIDCKLYSILISKSKISSLHHGFNLYFQLIYTNPNVIHIHQCNISTNLLHI
uniref:Uncharacterized protein n=1 Tax=Solanum lycopersicum TaxID=4081 RepID=A0A494G8V2_SOLLC